MTIIGDKTFALFTGTCIVSGSEDNTVIVWSLSTGSKLFDIKVHSDAVTAVKLKVRNLFFFVTVKTPTYFQNSFLKQIYLILFMKKNYRSGVT